MIFSILIAALLSRSLWRELLRRRATRAWGRARLSATPRVAPIPPSEPVRSLATRRVATNVSINSRSTIRRLPPAVERRVDHGVVAWSTLRKCLPRSELFAGEHARGYRAAERQPGGVPQR